jgi:radical SAM superfamily enzyme YgiQ (UPF0313 family)
MGKIRKVLFIQQAPIPSFGILSLSSVLAKHGFETDVICTLLETKYAETIRHIRPGMICISASSTQRTWAGTVAAVSKQIFPDIPVAIGGSHAILYPEDAIRLDGVDYACNSEGEVALLELLESISAGCPDKPVRGFWRKDSCGNVFGNGIAELIGDISLHREDRTVYYRRYPQLLKEKMRFFLASRGCLYNCSFCCNARFAEIYGRQWKAMRFKDPLFLISEVMDDRKKGGLEIVYFVDDLFAVNREWLKAFSAHYRERVKLPYMCHLGVEYINQETLALLKASGCVMITTGVETGNEDLRRKLLNKRPGNDVFLRAARLVKSFGLKLKTTNMFGLPAETLENSFETIELNVEMGTDIVASTIYTPIRDTPLWRTGIESGALAPDLSCAFSQGSFHRSSSLRSPDIQDQQILHKLCFFLARYPRLIPLMKRVLRNKSGKIRLMLRPVSFALFLIGFTYRFKSEKISFLDAIRFTYLFRKMY